MLIVNGVGTKSYLKCIDSKCKGLPTGILKGRHPRGYQIQIIFCESHESLAQGVSIRDFKGITFYPDYSPPWLRKTQESELQLLKEAESTSHTKEN